MKTPTLGNPQNTIEITAGISIGSRQGRNVKGSGKLCFNNCGEKCRRQKQKTAEINKIVAEWLE